MKWAKRNLHLKNSKRFLHYWKSPLMICSQLKNFIFILVCYSIPTGETLISFESTDLAIRENKEPVIHTTQTHFCSWKYFNMGYRLFVHKGDHTIELKIGKNPSTDRLLKGTENLERLLLNGEFNFEYNFLTYEEVKTYLKSSLVDQSYS